MTHRMTEESISTYRMTPAEKRSITGAETLLIPDQVASLFEVQRNTIYSWVKTGKLDAIRLPGNKIRFRRDYIEGIIGGTI